MNNKKQCFVRLSLSLVMGMALHVAQVHAQQIPAPPTYQFIDANGVNLVTGAYKSPGLDVGIGTNESGLQRITNETSDNFTGSLVRGFIARTANGDNGPGQLTLEASLGGAVYRFSVGGGNTRASATVFGGVYREINGVATLSCTGDPAQFYAGGWCAMILRNGAIAYYRYTSTSNGTTQWLIESLTMPDGEVQTYTYHVDGAALRAIKSVSSSLGWMLKYEVDANYVVNKVTAINTSVVYCDPAAPSCSVSSTFPTATLTISGSTRSIARNGVTLVTSTGSDGNVTLTSPTGIATTVARTLVAASLKVSSVTVGGSTWNYSYSTPPNSPQASTTVTNPDLTTRSVNFGIFGVARERDESGASRSFTHEDDGDLTGATEFGMAELLTIHAPYTTYGRDSRGNIINASTYPDGGGTPVVTTATYPVTCTNTKTCNKPTSVTEPGGKTTTFTYDPNSGGVLTETTSAVNGIQAQIRYTYSQYTPYVKNSAGNLVAQPPVWRVSGISRCMTAHLNACVGTTDEQKTTMGYTAYNVIPYTSTVMRGDGSLPQTTTLGIDDNGLTTSVDGPRSGTVDKAFFFYDGLGRKVAEIGPDPDGGGPRQRRASRVTYDADGRVSMAAMGTVNGTTVADLTAMSVQAYDSTDFNASSGLPIVARHYIGSVLTDLTQVSYDSRLRKVCEAQRLNSSVFGSVTSTSPCTPGPVGADGNDRITKYDYTSISQVSSVTSAYGTPSARIDFSKTFNGNRTVAAVVDGKGNRTGYTYDNFARLTKTCYPTPGTGSTTSTTDCESLSYTADGRLDFTILRDGQTINFGYDAVSRLSSKSGAVTESFSYNNFDQLVSHTNNAVTGTYSFNALGWLLSDTQPVGTVSYGYDANGRRDQLAYPGGLSVSYSYDDVNNLSGVVPSSGGTASFDYDNHGRRSHMYFGTSQTTTYSYDDASRLESVAQGSVNTLTLGYSQAGQITSKSNSNAAFRHTPSVATLTTYTNDGLNRIASVGSASIGHDSRGNFASDSSATYSYNANNLMTSAVQSGMTSTLTYDAENRLLSIAKSGAIVRFLYDGSNLIAEYDGSGNVLRRYVHGAGANEPLMWFEGAGTSDVRYLHSDQQGSITHVTNSAGTTLNVSAYNAYGLRSSSNPTYASRFAFTGQAYLPEIGLHYYRARIYSANHGRFMQADPIGYAAGMNRYTYVNGDPVNRNDPFGLDSAATIPLGDEFDVIEEVTTVGCGPACMARNALLIANVIGRMQFEARSEDTGGMLQRGKPHQYSIRTPTTCSPDDAFDTLMAPGVSAPGAPAANEGFRPRVELWHIMSPNPISQTVITSERTIINTTVSGHLFYPGDVMTQVVPMGTGSIINTVGTGTSSSPTWNNVIGGAFFGLRNYLIQTGCDAANGLPTNY